VSTGSTLKANNLVPVEEIMPISARLVVNQAALKLEPKSLQPLIDALRAASARREHSTQPTRRAAVRTAP
jgi:ATP phosphoribosyltransferase